MKKIISLFIILTTLAISCMSTTMASFVDKNIEINTSMQHEVIDVIIDDCCDTMDSDCVENTHECCISPFQDSSNINGINIKLNEDKKLKVKILDFNFFAILQEKLEENYIERLTSPPDLLWDLGEVSIYTELTGIIKNNC